MMIKIAKTSFKSLKVELLKRFDSPEKQNDEGNPVNINIDEAKERIEFGEEF